MNNVDATQRQTGARWWLGPLAVIFAGLIIPEGGLIIGLIFTAYLAIRKAPRRDVIAMAIATAIVGAILVAASVGYLDAYNDLRRVGSDQR